jgi:hypothetical protein
VTGVILRRKGGDFNPVNSRFQFIDIGDQTAKLGMSWLALALLIG